MRLLDVYEKAPDERRAERHAQYMRDWRAQNREQNREYHRELWKERTLRTIFFLDKKIELSFAVKRGICSQCGKAGITDLHHEMYVSCLPWACTVELCHNCHARISSDKAREITKGKPLSQEMKERMRKGWQKKRERE